MGKLIDLTGKKFGRLTVIKRSYPNSEDEYPNWLCKCECGNERIVRGDLLRNGHTKSCGCLRKETLTYRNEKGKLEQGISSMRQAITTYKKNAKSNGREYKLTEEQFKEITQKDCYYCGAKPDNVRKNKYNNGNYIYNGIDRIDNNKGYVTGNIVPCCKICNIAKHNLTIQEFKDWIRRVYNRLVW